MLPPPSNSTRATADQPVVETTNAEEATSSEYYQWNPVEGMTVSRGGDLMKSYGGMLTVEC
jgi:hypothetical protein